VAIGIWLAALSAAWQCQPAEFTIAAKPTGRPSAAQVQAGLDLLWRAAMGDGAADKAWLELPPLHRLCVLTGDLSWVPESVRRRAARELAAFPPAELDAQARRARLEALASISVREAPEDVRRAARQAWLASAQAGDRDALRPMAAIINRAREVEGQRAFENLKAAGGPAVIEVLITEIHWRWGPFPRSHILIGRQRSYISDYEISGSSYKPVIRQLMSGTVLDVKVLEVLIIQYIVEQLRYFGAPDDIVRNPPEWLKWVREFERLQLGR
jgi:hypothetical protein